MLRPSLLIGVGYYKEEGTLVEEGAPISRSSSTCAISDLFGSWWRRHTTSCLCASDSSLCQGGGMVHHFNGYRNKEEGCTFLGTFFLEPVLHA
jgi:hypothetical protein